VAEPKTVAALADKNALNSRKKFLLLLPCAGAELLLFPFIFIRANVKNKISELQCFLLKKY
jgi:hypothetical protein